MSENNVEFKEPRRLTTWIKYLLYVQVAIALIAIGSNLMEYQLLTDFQNGVYFNQENIIRIYSQKVATNNVIQSEDFG